MLCDTLFFRVAFRSAKVAFAGMGSWFRQKPDDVKMVCGRSTLSPFASSKVAAAYTWADSVADAASVRLSHRTLVASATGSVSFRVQKNVSLSAKVWGNASFAERKATLLLIALAFLNAAFVCAVGKGIAQQPSSKRYSIAIHGGAGVEPHKLNAAEKLAHEDALRKALFTGRDLLAKGGTALDAVEQTIRVLEDEPLFNAGRGAVFNNVGTHELDAAIADGATHNGGAVAGVTTIKNPISLARLVMTDTNHVLLIGDGAEKFADEMKSKPAIERVPNSYFSTEHRRTEWKVAVEKETQAKTAKATGKGTVGCVVLDTHGNLAAGTSTGGLTNKKWGRVGSVPILGAGTFADNETLAVSGTGIGEHFIRNSVGFHLHALMKFRSMSLAAAVEEMTDRILEPDTAGIIAIDKKGQIMMRCNTPGMSRASANSQGEIHVLLTR